jgi:replicative DNA helicase
MNPQIKSRMEARLLSSMLHDPKLTATVMHWLPPELWHSPRAFRDYAARQLADCVADCWAARRDTSPLNVLEAATRRQMKGVEETVRSVMAAHLAEHVSSVERLAEDYAAQIRREGMGDLLSRAQELVADEGRESADVLREIAERLAAGAGSGQNVVSSEEAAESLSEMYSLRKAGKGEDIGVHTGFRKIDAVIGGLPVRKISIIGARPSQGKTALAGCVAINAAKAGHPVVFFSHEMSARDVYARMAAQLRQVSYSNITYGSLSSKGEAKLAAALEELRRLPIHVVDSTHSDPDTCRSTALYVLSRCRGGRAPLVVVDYVQLEHLPGWRGTRSEEIGQISWKWLETAKMSGAAVLLLSQLNRDAVGQPSMDQLRESGALEQDASVIGLLWRPSRDKKQGTDANAEVSSTDRRKAGFNWGVLSIPKSRDSALTEQELHWTGYCMSFRDWDEERDRHTTEAEQRNAEYAAMLEDIVKNRPTAEEVFRRPVIEDGDLPKQEKEF